MVDTCALMWLTEHCDGGRTMIKKYVTGSQQDGRIYVRILFAPKKKSWDLFQVRLLHCGILPSSLRVLSLLLVFLAGLPLVAYWLPAFFLLFLWCCSKSEDSVINLRIQHSNCLWPLFLLSFTCTLSSSHVSMHYTLSMTVCTHLANSASPISFDILFFSWGHDPYTLACKARPSFDGCGTSLSVSLSLSLSLSFSPPPPPPTLFPQCLSSRKTVARPSFSITEHLQVVPKHLGKCCQAFNFQFMKCCPWSRKKSHILLTGLHFFVVEILGT